MTEFHVDFHELDTLVDDVGQARKRIQEDGRRIVSKGSFNIKKDWRDRWRGHPHIPRLPFDITYDVTARVAHITGEIGPDKERGQGPLGNIIEFGTINNAPIPGGLPALKAEEPNFVAACERLAEKIVARE